MKKSTYSRLLFILHTQIVLSIVLILGALFIFLKIGNEILGDEVFSFDITITNFIYSFRSPQMTYVMLFITSLGGAFFLFILSIITILYIATKRRKDAIIYSIILYTGVILNIIVKQIVQRPRPHHLPLIREDSFSFPSGHAMNSFVFYAAFSYFILRETKNTKIAIVISIVSVLLVLCIGLSRIYLGVHYPSDVVAGYIAGFIWFISAILFEKTIIFRRLHKSIKK